MRAYERLLQYVKIYTTSDEESETVPSAERQLDLARLLVEEMRELGVAHARMDDQGYVYGEIPATPGYENAPVIGFIAHMDTAPDFNGEGVKPCVTENYNGEDIVLGESGRVIRVKDFPHLPALKGRTLITAEGNTLLGADDKAGIAEILTMAEEILQADGERKTGAQDSEERIGFSGGEKGKIFSHGKICLAFTPDEEIGRGADAFDVPGFGAKYAYTVDGGAENEIEYENFNAAAAKVKIRGFSVHPGSSKDTMINAALVAKEFSSMLPAG